MQHLQWFLNQQQFVLKSNTLKLSHCADPMMSLINVFFILESDDYIKYIFKIYNNLM